MFILFISGAVPWKSLTYRNLSDLYLLWQTGIRLTQDKYPEVIFDILNQGLSINSKQRVSISALLKKFVIAKVNSFLMFLLLRYPIE